MATQSSVSGEAIIIGPQQFFIYFSDHGVFLFMGHMEEKTHTYIYIYIYNIKKYLFIYAFIFNSLTIV